MSRRTIPIAIIGAGPYGLSLCAHLNKQDSSPAIFGRPMSSWRDGAPPGMRLKSDGFASSLSAPGKEFTLKAFCQSQGLAYADCDFPIPVGTFIAYGDAFQKRFAPQLDTRLACQIREARDGFEIELEDGETLVTSQCVIATGLTGFEFIPEVLGLLSRKRLVHTADLWDYSGFSRTRVLVIGAGASATNAAGELLRCGAEVTLVCRGEQLKFYPGGFRRGMKEAITAPRSPLGPGWGKWAASRYPGLFRTLPERLRAKIVDTTLGPAPGWFVREEIEGKITVLAAQKIVRTSETSGGVRVEMIDPDGAQLTREFDHIIAGTGYKVDLDRLRLLSPALRSRLTRIGSYPKLSRNFESSVAGLYFAGVSAAYGFGPALRFVCGAEYASRQVSAAIIASLDRRGKSARRSWADPAICGSNSLAKG